MSRSKWVRVGSVRRFDHVEPDKGQALKIGEEVMETFSAWEDFWMPRKHNAFYDPHADAVALKAHDLWMAGETAQDVARALGISVPAVYKAVALVARNPRPFRKRWERYMERTSHDEG